ncbi:MAG: tetratricopeptide repeat protein [Candidatus Helarchaeota archaeon]
MSKFCYICDENVSHLKKHYKKKHPIQYLIKFNNPNNPIIQDKKNLLRNKKKTNSIWSFMCLNFKVEVMRTQKIIEKLKKLNINFDIEHFKMQAKNFSSAEKLQEEHYSARNLDISGMDQDFILFAICELWKRLLPQKINIETITDLIQIGYDFLEKNNHKKAVAIWEHVWIMLKKILPPNVTSINEADDLFTGQLQYPSNWFYDFIMELYNGGKENRVFFKKRIRFCEEFCNRFPNSSSQTLTNLLIEKADSYAILGEIETAEKIFQDIIRKFPKNPWGYIRWGDIYCHPRNLPEDYEKAENIYRTGLKICETELDVIQDRLESLNKEKINFNEKRGQNENSDA